MKFEALSLLENASWPALVRALSKSFCAAALLPSDCSKAVSGAGAVSTLLMKEGNVVSEFGAVTPAVRAGEEVGSVTGEMVGAVSEGESCQFQNLVRSIFSADEQRPSTPSPSTPCVGKAMMLCGGLKLACW